MISFLRQAESLLATAANNRHRVLITFSGEQQWAEQQATDLLDQQQTTPLWVSDSLEKRPEAIDFNSSRRWLGREVDALVFDAHSGFDPNIFALLCGTVKAGGALILLTPALERWDLHADPVNNRCSIWGQSVQRSRYLARLSLRIPDTSQLLVQQGKEPRCVKLLKNESTPSSFNEQKKLVHQLADQFENAPVQLAIISGDRGRGKSAALGQLAAEFARRGAHRLLVSAPRKAAVDVLLVHARNHWPDDAPKLETCLNFVSPDSLSLEPQACDVLLVDEMGGIHLGLLTKLLAQYPRLIMAGTVHGYEGAGRGFHTRLRNHVVDHYPHGYWSNLQQPIRWASDDPLERSCNDLLMLNAESKAIDTDCAAFDWLDRNSLAIDEPLLRQIYGLLATAHYRTRPLDLRQMLDGPNLRLAVLRREETVLAACLVAQEGPINDDELIAEIMAGRRRPSGHLLPQLLLQKRQIPLAATGTFWRVVRIAVQPECQNQGFGSELLQHLQREARAAGINFIGSIFAADGRVIRFWTRAEYHPVLLGDNCEATSGSYALTVLKPLTSAADFIFASAKDCWTKYPNKDLKKSHPALSAELRTVIKQSQRTDTIPE